MKTRTVKVTSSNIPTPTKAVLYGHLWVRFEGNIYHPSGWYSNVDSMPLCLWYGGDNDPLPTWVEEAAADDTSAELKRDVLLEFNTAKRYFLV